jgi:hypothetical protein
MESPPPASLLDRDFQRTILEKLAAIYPAVAQPAELGADVDDPRWAFNVMYLSEHRLVEATVSKVMGSRVPMIPIVRINAAGIDFLQDDGGLSAILGVVTVRFEAETIKQLIDARLEASGLPEKEKSAIRSKLRELGGDALKEVTKRLLGAALDHWPEAIQTVQTLIG